jgi:hypothetical protein
MVSSGERNSSELNVIMTLIKGDEIGESWTIKKNWVSNWNSRKLYTIFLLSKLRKCTRSITYVRFQVLTSMSMKTAVSGMVCRVVLSTRLHSATSQKTVVFKRHIIRDVGARGAGRLPYSPCPRDGSNNRSFSPLMP